MIAVRGGLPAQLMGHLFNHQPLRSSTTTSTISAATTISSQQLHHHHRGAVTTKTTTIGAGYVMGKAG